LLFPHVRQALRIQRRRRLYGAKKWSSETVYAGYVNTAAGRRAHTERHLALALYGIT
ncbi:ISAs1 family transposase, partial [Streptomyces sp. NPDC058440]